jgi:hypothetical protein
MSVRLATDPRNWARHLLGHVYTVWFMHLPVYANSTPFKRDVLLRAFKVLQTNQAKTPDEVLQISHHVKSAYDSILWATVRKPVFRRFLCVRYVTVFLWICVESWVILHWLSGS